MLRAQFISIVRDLCPCERADARTAAETKRKRRQKTPNAQLSAKKSSATAYPRCAKLRYEFGGTEKFPQFPREIPGR